MKLELKFSDSDWERISQDWQAWWQGELNLPLVVLECIETLDGYNPHCSNVFIGNYPSDTSIDCILNDFTPRLANTHYLGDSFPRFWPNFGPGIVAAFSGAKVHPAWDTTWFTPGQSGPINKLRITTDWENLWWKRVYNLTQAAVDQWGSDLAVWITDLGGNLDILASLRDTRQLLQDLVKQPEEVDRLVGEAHSIWMACFDRLTECISTTGKGITCWGPCWANGRGYMLQSDFSYMISPRMFERFVLPDLESCCEAMDYAFYHLDGKSQLVHIDTLLSIQKLRGIQWVPGYGKPACDEWLPLLKKIRDGGKLCQVTVQPQGAMTIMRELGGKGFLFVIDEPQLTPAQGNAFLEALQKMD